MKSSFHICFLAFHPVERTPDTLAPFFYEERVGTPELFYPERARTPDTLAPLFYEERAGTPEHFYPERARTPYHLCLMFSNTV